MKAQDEIPGKQQGGDRQCSGKQIQKSDSEDGPGSWGKQWRR